MFGSNPLRPPVQGDGLTLDVQSVFSTLQGEGPYAGWPSIFIRLGGCNLACVFCDTEFESFSSLSLSEILSDVQSRTGDPLPMVVITGGEPFRQPIERLCEALIERGYRVQVETNGTLYRPIHENVEIVCSPKAGDKGYFPVRFDVLRRLQALKFLVSATHPYYGAVPEVGQAQTGTPVYVQPMDEGEPEKNAANIQFAVALAQKHGYRLSLQLHKLLGIE